MPASLNVWSASRYSDQVVGGVVRVQTDRLPQLHVDDVSGGVARVRDRVQALAVRVVGLHEVLGDLDHALVQLVDDRIVGEIMEHAGLGQQTVVDVAVDGDHVRLAVLDQTGAQIGDRVRGVVHRDLDIRMRLLEFARLLREPVAGFGLVLEEINRHRASISRTTSRKGCTQRDRNGGSGEATRPARCRVLPSRLRGGPPHRTENRLHYRLLYPHVPARASLPCPVFNGATTAFSFPVLACPPPIRNKMDRHFFQTERKYLYW